MKTLDNKVAVITGAGSGIGRALAIQLAHEGCHLALSDISGPGLQETASLVKKSVAEGSDRKLSTHILDVADRAQIYQHATDVVALHGRVDLLFNNAGVVAKNTIEAMSYEDFEWVIGINMWGVVYGTKAFLPYLKQQPEAHIINIASINSMLGFPENGPYTMSKFAIQGFTETLIQEYMGTTLRISSVHPGGIRTAIARSARNIQKHEIDVFSKIAATSPERAAQIIIKGVKRNREKIFVGPDAVIMQGLKRLFPNASVRLVGFLIKRSMSTS